MLDQLILHYSAVLSDTAN